MIEGVKILDKQEILSYSWGWSTTGLMLCILAIIILIAMFCFAFDDMLIYLASFAVIALSIAGILSFYTAHKEFDHYHYKVTVDETTPANEFVERYRILEQEGLILTIEER